MMHECKRILNKQVAGEGLWHADLVKAQNLQDGEVAEVREACNDTDDGSDVTDAAENSGAEDGDADGATRAAPDSEDAEHTNVGVIEHTNDAEQTDLDTCIADEAERVQMGDSEHEGKAQIFQVTISLRDDWLHRGDALQDMDLQTYAEHTTGTPPMRANAKETVTHA